ncbi:MAG TPA: hypothetical protein VL119_11025 [Acidimicrobiia bacterium]|nr:hypothetical protein [Acidimicrobiia bacterium]
MATNPSDGEQAQEFGRRKAVPEELLVRVTPVETIAISGRTDSL